MTTATLQMPAAVSHLHDPSSHAKQCSLTISKPAQLKHTYVGNVHKRQSLAVDPMLLSKKLEALEQASNPARRARRHSTGKAVFVPRTAAQQFSATTTPMDDAVKRSKSTKAKRLSHVPIAEEPHSTADGKPVMNTKTMMAALNIGMSESEAAAATSEPLKRISSSSREREKRSSQDRRDSVPDAGVQRSTSRAYRPGDAAKRNAAKRSSMNGDFKFVAIKHGSQTVYERVDNPHKAATGPDLFANELEQVPEYRAARDREVEMPYDLPQPDDNEEQPLGTQRPKILPHDRPHWAQQSQCGDDMRSHLLHIPLHRNRDKADAPAQKQLGVKRPETLRRHSSAPSQKQEGTMINEAVTLIKKGERKQRRQSVMSFFKKL